jgi:predicted dehydrogenase
MNKLRWGILSTANIGRKNWKAIHQSGNAVVTAVASRDVERSRKFIGECQADAPFETSPSPLGSYEELLASKTVDAVYIPLPTGLRKEWVLRAAAAGKHVICEKPCAINAVDVREMIAACKKNNVQFMDGVMFMHNARMNRMRAALDGGPGIGEIRRIMSAFSFHMDEKTFDANVRVDSRLEPAGCLGDLGWYCIRFALWTMGWQLPREVTGRILSARGARSSPSPVPVDFSAELIFDGGASAGFYCSFLSEYQNWVHVSGTKGSLRLADFVHASSDHEPAFEVNQTETRVKCCDCKADHNATGAVAQQTQMFRNFSKQIHSGKLNDEWPMTALKTQQVTDACFESAQNGGRPVQLASAK